MSHKQMEIVPMNMADIILDDAYSQILSYQQDYDEQTVVFYLDLPPSPSESGENVTTHLADGAEIKDVMDAENSEQTMSSGKSPSSSQDVSQSGSEDPAVQMAQNDSTAQVVSGGDGDIRFIDEDADSQLDEDAALLLAGDAGPRGSATDVRLGEGDQGSDAVMKTPESTEGDVRTSGTPSTADIMTRFEETEKIFRERFLSPSLIDLSVKKQAQLEEMPPPPVSPIGDAGIGEHLEQLIKVLEQLAFLRSENEQLQKKCCFLENTRYLLQLQNDMLMARDCSRSRTRFKQNQRVMNFFDSAANRMALDMTPARPRRNRLPSDGVDELYRTTPPENVAKLSRSQSDGSLELVDMEFGIETEPSHAASPEKASSPTTRDYFMSRADFQKKSRKLQQKWERVKKVFSGKPEHASKTDAVSTEQLVKANTKQALEKRCPADLENLPKPESGLEDNPPSPNSVHSEPTDVHAYGKGPDGDGKLRPAALKRSFSADSITSDSTSSPNQQFTFDEQSVSNASEISLERIRYQQLGGHLERRRSSPTLSVHDGDKDYICVPLGSARMVRSSSVKLMKSNADLDIDARSGKKITSSDAAKKAKAAWVRVKDIIHTRKDSLKKSKQIGQALSDGEISPEELGPEARFHIGDGSEAESHQSRDRTKKPRTTGSGPVSASQRRLRNRTVAASTISPGLKYKRKSLAHVMLGNSPTDVASAMGITDDFNKRMQEWEEKKKKGLVKANSFSYDMDSQKSFDTSTKFTEDFIKKMEEWEQMKGLTSPPKSPDQEKEVINSEQVTTLEAGPKVPLKNLSESFSKTVQEWERVKERRAREGTSPGPEGRGRERYVERSKSRERDRSRHKFEKEIQKIERKEWKIEREKQKLERMKMKLDMAMESSSGSEGFGEGMTYEMLKKQLQDRDARLLLQQQTEDRTTMPKHESTTEDGVGFHTRFMSVKDFSTDGKPMSRDRVFSDSCIQPLPAQRSLSYEAYAMTGESSHEHGGMAALEAPPRDIRGKSSETDDSGTQQYTSSSERSISTLLQQLDDKDEQIKDLQYDVQQLTDRITYMDQDHNRKIESYKRQLKAAHRISQYACQTYQIDGALRDLRAQVDVLIQAQDILVKEKLALEKKIQDGVEDHEKAKAQFLVQLRELQEKVDLLCGPHSSQPRPTVTSLCGLVNQAQDQLSRLQQTLSSRTSTIRDLERHLLTQTVTNKLLEAGLQRQALEINYLLQKKKRHAMKRSRTFSGQEFWLRQEGQSDTRRGTKLQEECKSYYSLSKRPTSTNTVITLEPSDFDLPVDWLNEIHKQLEEECMKPPEVATSPPVTSSQCQTTLTLIQQPQEALQLEDEEKADASSVVSAIPKAEAADKDTRVETKSAATQTESVMNEAVIKATVTDVTIPVVYASCEFASKPGILKSSPHPVARTKGISEIKTAHSSGSTTSGSSAGNVPKRHSYQEWIEREPKPLRLDTGRTPFDISDVSQSGKMSSQSSDEVFTSKEEIASDAERERNSQKLVSPHLPQSPVIRSKNVRKLRNADNRSAAITGDARTWKATPPRRFIRHRKNMVERLSMGAVLAENDAAQRERAASERQRTKSDSSELSRACEIARQNSAKKNQGEARGSAEHISAIPNLLEVRSYVSRHTARSSSGVRDMINKYEEGNFSRGGAFRKSPSPSVPKVSVTATRRLKTAAELLQDSIDQKQHRTRSASTSEKPTPPQLVREKIPSTSSDKENHNNRSRSHDDVQFQSQYNANVDVWRSAKSALMSSVQPSVTNDLAANPEVSRPLKDVTNDNTEQGSNHGIQSHDQESSDITHPSTSLAPSEETVKSKKAAVLILSPAGSQVKQPRTVQITAKGESTLDPKTARHMSKGDSTDSQSTWSCRSSEQDDSCTDSGSPWHLAKEPTKASPSPVITQKAERKSRSKCKPRFWSKEPGEKSSPKVRGLFEKKRTKSQSPCRAGAISTLCMQTMTLSVDEDSSDSQQATMSTSNAETHLQESAPRSPGSDTSDKRSRRQKFLDSNWFQKPKGLFRVSKC